MSPSRTATSTCSRRMRTTTRRTSRPGPGSMQQGDDEAHDEGHPGGRRDQDQADGCQRPQAGRPQRSPRRSD
eukprot:466918-Prymnesium_polylepis.1